MIRRSPCEYYIKYLMFLPEKLTDADIVRTLREHHLDYPGASYLRRLRASLDIPPIFRPRRASDIESYRFLQKHKVHRMFFPDKDMEITLQCLDTPQAKEILEAMLLADEDRATILHRMEGFGYRVTAQSLAYYQHFFFNLLLVDATEMRALLQLRIEDMTLGEDDPETLLRYKALKQASFQDPRTIAAHSINKYIASTRLQIRHGLEPTRLDFQRLADYARHIATVGAIEEGERRGVHGGQNMRDFATVASIFNDILKEQGGGHDTVHKAMVTIAHDNKPLRSLQEVTGGNYTEAVTIQPEEKSNVK